MNIPLKLFPVVTQDIIDKIGFESSNYEFEYLNDGVRSRLNVEPVDSQSIIKEYLINDDRCEWTAEQHDLCIRRKLVLNNPGLLFGENRIACKNTELGLALLWTSKTSNQRGVKIISGFKYSNKRLFSELEYTFPSGHLRGSANLQIVLFIKTPGKPTQNEGYLANDSGIILGTLDESKILIDGNGSVFPIVEAYEVSQPLWWVTCDWNDPIDDSFDEENISICLNKAHVDFPLLKLDEGLKGSPMLLDIIADAIQIIIQKVKESGSWEAVIKGENLEPGSVAEAVHYFITTFNWDYSSPEKLALTIRRDFDSRIQRSLI
jgi:hypothetical protein